MAHDVLESEKGTASAPRAGDPGRSPKIGLNEDAKPSCSQPQRFNPSTAP